MPWKWQRVTQRVILLKASCIRFSNFESGICFWLTGRGMFSTFLTVIFCTPVKGNVPRILADEMTNLPKTQEKKRKADWQIVGRCWVYHPCAFKTCSERHVSTFTGLFGHVSVMTMAVCQCWTAWLQKPVSQFHPDVVLKSEVQP